MAARSGRLDVRTRDYNFKARKGYYAIQPQD